MRCQSEKDCCANINAVVDQTKSDQEMENRIENEQNNKRYKKYAEKVLRYQRSILVERGSHLHKILMRMIRITYDLQYSKQNLTIVRELSWHR